MTDHINSSRKYINKSADLQVFPRLPSDIVSDFTIHIGDVFELPKRKQLFSHINSIFCFSRFQEYLCCSQLKSPFMSNMTHLSKTIPN